MERIFGPVPSRRLGRSLGIDVIPYKTCTFDCVYCECGATTGLTCARREFYPLDELLAELEAHVAALRDKPDVITLSGSGEPTLYARTGDLIREAKRMTRLPVAVITNSALLDRPEVREELLEADIVLPSLDAATEEAFQRVNRPHPSCELARIIRGLEVFSAAFGGRILLEMLFIEGGNTDAGNLEALKAAAARIRHDAIQLNTAVRPGTESGALPLDEAGMERLLRFFGPRCEIIGAAKSRAMRPEDEALEERLLALLRRRPCTAEDLSSALGIPAAALVRMLDLLAKAGKVTSGRHGEAAFYVAAERTPADRAPTARKAPEDR